MRTEPLRDLAKANPAFGWSSAGRDVEDGQPYVCDTICNAYPPFGGR